MNHPAPLVSVLVPTYNTAQYLPLLCASVQAQTLGDFEVVLVDDGSTDNTAEVLEPFRRDARFHIHTAARNQGAGLSTLAALRLARGQFWCVPGADDVLMPDFLEARVERLRASPDASLVQGPYVAIDDRGQTMAHPYPHYQLPPRLESADALALLLQHNVISCPGIMARTQATQAVLPYYAADWLYAYDWFLWILLAAAGGAFLFDDVKRHQYRFHPHSLTNTQQVKPARRAEVRLVPLCALSVATQFSPAARLLWKRWRRDLYALWLRRAWNLSREGALNPEWLRHGARAIRGGGAPAPNLTCELLCHFPALVCGTIHERLARRGQRFAVTGLARVNHPVLRNP